MTNDYIVANDHRGRKLKNLKSSSIYFRTYSRPEIMFGIEMVEVSIKQAPFSTFPRPQRFFSRGSHRITIDGDGDSAAGFVIHDTLESAARLMEF